MTIGKRLGLLILTAIVALAIVGSFGLNQVGRVSATLNGVTEGNIPRLIEVGRIHVNYEVLRGLMFRMVADDNDQRKEALSGQIEQTRARLNQSVAAYRKLISGPQDKALFDDFSKQLNAYFVVYPTVVKRAKLNQNKEALELANGMFVENAAQSVADSLDALVAFNEKAAHATRQQAEQVRAEARKVLGIAAAVATVLLVVIGAVMWRRLSGPLKLMSRTVGEIGRSLDFTQRIPVRQRDEVGETLTAFNSLLDTLQQSLRDIANGTHGVGESATALSQTAGEVARSAGQQSEAAASMAATVEQVTVSISHVSTRADEANALTAESGRHAEHGEVVVRSTVGSINGIAGAVNDAASTIEELQQHSARMGSVVAVIREVADQTNLLALNAAIEAARAGEQGRGFAVVADEVRKLAERTAASTQEISAIIASIQAGAGSAVTRMQDAVQRVEAGVQQAGEAGVAIDAIRRASSEVVSVVGEITGAIREQSAATTNIARQVERIAQMTDSNNAAAEQTADSAARLDQLAREMQATVARYRI